VDDRIRHRNGLSRSFDAFDLRRISRFAQPRGVDERQSKAVEIQRFGDEIARRPWTIGHDGAVSAKQRIEETRLPDVRVADDGDLESFANEPPATSAGQQRAGLREEVVERARQRAWFDEMISLLWKIDGRFEACDEIEQARIDAGDRARERTFQLIECRSRLQRGDRIDQIRDRLGLHQVDPAVEKRAEREFAWLGRARSAIDGRGDDRAQDDRAPMCAHLDDVVSGVRRGRGKVGDDRLIANIVQGFGDGG
jgi:hypothetical protein